jgi:hypothetical protein
MNVPDNCVKTSVFSPTVTTHFDGGNVVGNMTINLT